MRVKRLSDLFGSEEGKRVKAIYSEVVKAFESDEKRDCSKKCVKQKSLSLNDEEKITYRPHGC